MKILFATILLMIAAIVGCTADDLPVLEKGVSDAVEVDDITVEDVEELVPSDTEVSLDDVDAVPTVEEDVEN